MIRRATIEDVARVVELGAAFHAHSPWREVAYDREATGDFVARVIGGLGAVFLSETGMVGGILSPLFFNPKVIVGVETFWWAPSGGRLLREAFEHWAMVENGASAVQFSALADENIDRIDAIYRRSGFQRAETAYLKGLLNGGT